MRLALILRSRTMAWPSGSFASRRRTRLLRATSAESVEVQRARTGFGLVVDAPFRHNFTSPDDLLVAQL